MKRLVEFLTDVRLVVGEIGGTVTLIFLVAYGTHKAWEEFIVKLFR
jgi:hypothetical protein